MAANLWNQNLGMIKNTVKFRLYALGLIIFVQKAFFGWVYFRGSMFSEGLIIGRNFPFQNGLGLTIKTA